MSRRALLLLGMIVTLGLAALIVFRLGSSHNVRQPPAAFPANLAELLAQHEDAGANESKSATQRLDDARMQMLRGEVGWSGAGKYFKESILLKPTVEGLIGYAEASVIMPTPRETGQECADLKRRLMARSMSYFKLAISFSEAIGEPFPRNWPRSFVAARVTCIRDFLAGQEDNRPAACNHFIAITFQSCK